MADLRELLRQAAGDPPTTLPLTDIRNRGRAIARRRQTVIALMLGVLLAGAGVAVASSRPATPPEGGTQSRTQLQSPGILRPGTYHDGLIAPGLDFTVPAGAVWRANLVTPDSLVLNNDALQIVVALHRWTQVYLPQSGSTPPVASAKPPDLISWLANHPALHPIAAPTATVLGGRPAHRLSLTVNSGRPIPTGPVVGCAQLADCVLLAATPDNPIVVYADRVTTIIVADDVDGLVLAVEVPVGTSVPSLPLLDTLTFD
jgi:hypothetical protein